MARPWKGNSAARCVSALFAQHNRRRVTEISPRPVSSVLAGLLFMAALAIIPITWGRNSFAVWMLFIAPLLAGGSGAIIRPMVDRMRGTQVVGSAVLATLVLGSVAGGISGVLFVTAQLAGSPNLSTAAELAGYAQHSIPFAVGVGFVAGLTSRHRVRQNAWSRGGTSDETDWYSACEVALAGSTLARDRASFNRH